jgi:hypothetical protein
MESQGGAGTKRSRLDRDGLSVSDHATLALLSDMPEMRMYTRDKRGRRGAIFLGDVAGDRFIDALASGFASAPPWDAGRSTEIDAPTLESAPTLEFHDSTILAQQQPAASCVTVDATSTHTHIGNGHDFLERETSPRDTIHSNTNLQSPHITPTAPTSIIALVETGSTSVASSFASTEVLPSLPIEHEHTV